MTPRHPAPVVNLAAGCADTDLVARHRTRAAALVAVAFAAGTAGAAPMRAASERMSGCSRPLTYDVVRVDPRFHVSRASFVALLERAERLWEVPMQRDLLRYEPGGEVHVSLVYDARTSAYLARARTEKTIDAKDALIARLRASLERASRELDRRSAELNRRKAALRKRIDYWNARGGAPAKIFGELAAEDHAVRALVTSYNRDLERGRRAKASFNALVHAYNALVLGVRGKAKVELGHAQLGGTEMTLDALTGNAAKDATLAAHEFGHILGLQHIPGAGNIMNPYLVRALPHASPADLAALRNACADPSRP